MESGFDARALSQGEIDSLLAKLATEGNNADQAADQSWRVVKEYDFRRPDKLSKDQMRILQLLHESFGRLASSSLSAYLRTAVQLNMASIEQTVYGEYIDQMPADTVLYILTMEPMVGTALIALDLRGSMAAVDRLLGGMGVVQDAPPPPTDIELALVQTLVANVLRALKEAWQRVAVLTPTIRDVVLDPRFVQVALKSDPVVVVAFEMGILHHSGTVTLCLPYAVLEPILPKLTAQLWFASAQRGGAATQTEQLCRNLHDVKVDLVVELGGASVTLKELEELKEGDVIALDRGRDKPLDILVGRRRKFIARPGMIGNKLAVELMSEHDESRVQALPRPAAELRK